MLFRFIHPFHSSKHRKATIFLVVVGVWLMLGCQRSDPPEVSVLSEQAFLDPSTENRPMALWTWMNGYVDTVQLVYELQEMKDKGMRGAIVWDIGALINPDGMIPDGPAFLGPESLQYLALALATSDSLGLDLGMSAASSWNSGGEWVRAADGSKELLRSSYPVEGPATVQITLSNPESPRGRAENCELLTVIAVPKNPKMTFASEEVIVLSEQDRAGAKLSWQAPEGEWELLSFFSCNTMQPLVVPSPNSSGLIIDHLSGPATARHLEELVSRLDRISTAVRKMKFIFLDSYEVWQMTDWTDGFLEEFQQRYGYDPTPFLPLLQGYNLTDSLIQARFEGDYRRLVSDLLIENHYAQAVKIGDKHGIQMITEAGHGGHPRVEPLKALGNSHIPMGEFWNRQRHWVTKEAASAAHIYGHTVVASESLTGWNHWQHGPTDFKQLIDIAFCEGLNQVVFHTFSHNPAIAGKPGFVYHAGEHVNVNATWWPYSRPFMDYIARSSYLLRQGNFVADILLYYGDDAPNLVPPKRVDPNYTPDMPGIFPTYFYDKTKCPHCGMPRPIRTGDLPGYEYDYINADVITNRLEAEDGKLRLPHGASYRLLVLPDRADMSLDVLKSLEKLIGAGAVVLGPKPERASSLKGYPAVDREVKDLADKIWGNTDGQTVFSTTYGAGTVYWGRSIEEVLKELQIRPDVAVKGPDNSDRHIDFVHRQTETEEIYFISNSSEQQEQLRLVFRVDPDLKPELWDAASGLVQREVAFTRLAEGIKLDLVLEPIGSRFVVFQKNIAGENSEGLHRDLQFGFSEKGLGDTDVPSIDLSNDWLVRFDRPEGDPLTVKMDSLVSWSDLNEQEARYHSGQATYFQEFRLEASQLQAGVEAFVRFEAIQEMAQVQVNGKDCGIVWLPPYTARITPHLREGTNILTVRVINTWNNRIVGDLRHPEAESVTRTNARGKFTANSPLLQSGLLGKAEIQFLTQN
ncbi:alpha-L-rhamnosidase [Cyclobacterium xiamenense]|uniref:Alpha-L-rhamnosidase n=1 Tax=Cyclobacterium xiamenense TaxID=1297121 RepID=A0A1H6TIH5_9BACT|nr:glycosyl hydrolase [Cyclobacterium xiamenense]SEI76060.1 alpha-L-rhamnosidase [Cyclobacterium xiamenense]